MTEMRKLPRSQMRTYAARLHKEQGGLCKLCGEFIDMRIKGEGVLDHDHDTGEIRGLLHRSCNAAEGKITNAAGHWGCKSMKYSAIIPYLERVLVYLKSPGLGMIYPLHKTADEKRVRANARARERRAELKARRAMKESK